MSGHSIKLLGISGSLRNRSRNHAVLRAAASFVPVNAAFAMYDGLDRLPHFNPDLDMDGIPVPVSVSDLREQVKAADAVLVCTPEYAGGVPGVLKNALDWLVSSAEFMDKPTAVISASPSTQGGDKAHASLLITLSMMSARIVEGATLTIPLVSKKLDDIGQITDPETEEALRSLVESLLRAVQPS